MDKGPVPPDPALMALIARELATEAYTLEQILARYVLTHDEFQTTIASNPYFQRVLHDYTKEWQSLGSTHKRLAYYAAAALEEKLPALAHRMGAPSTDLADATNTAKLFRDIAGIATPGPGSGAPQGPQFTISIDFGHSKVAVETARGVEAPDEIRGDPSRQIENQPVSAQPDAGGEPTQIRPFTPGESN